MTSAPLLRPPAYVVPFATAKPDAPYFPLVAGTQNEASGITVPHGLDRDVAAALPGLWYALHLPNSFSALTAVPARVLRASRQLDLGHEIILVPLYAFDEATLGNLMRHLTPVLAICPDEITEEAAERARTLGFALPSVAFSQLSNELLREHWDSIRQKFSPEEISRADDHAASPSLTTRIDLAPTSLPYQHLVGRLGESSYLEPDETSVLPDLVSQAIKGQILIAALARLEAEGHDAQMAVNLLPQVAEAESSTLKVPLAVALPGVSSAYVRQAYEPSLRKNVATIAACDPDDVWPRAILDRPDVMIERAAIEFVATHRAIARAGNGLLMPSVPQRAFTLLRELEKHFAARTPNGAIVGKFLRQITETLKPLWTDEMIEMLRRASSITAFSNFPLGLACLPGDTAPLLTTTPITYRPLLPLTRALQDELEHVDIIDLSGKIRILVVECISTSDPVGAISRNAWRSVEQKVLGADSGIKFERRDVGSASEFRDALTAVAPDILIISAHGGVDPTGQIAGLHVGRDFVAGPGLGPLPPVVLLSACSTAPRGASAISITDLLFREGAVAILGTQVPVDVRHNAILMTRFFVYLAEVRSGRRDFPTLLEVWHHVQSSNAVNDIMGGSSSLRSWLLGAGPSGKPVLQEFMDTRSRGRLRSTHIYEDTEKVLGDIAEDQGRRSQVENWFRRPGYVPESLFYVLAGRPERIYFRDPMSIVAGAKLPPT
ncbi:CHAT domain-containing protein [Actinoplanes sp. DH11]|uniref:CHAT domain-containing protein n=1 Tax=Actinoplanes sp. DH11 TaxID=2857011 RepID=UPI001E46BC12|nr:CHAT domain-containing protein [Actinoplanes sp. DH11]